MKTLKVTPGPSAHSAFRFGVLAAAAAGLAVVGFLYWYGLVALAELGYLFVLIFPLYLVLAACALSVWLGFDKDASDLRPVYRSNERS